MTHAGNRGRCGSCRVTLLLAGRDRLRPNQITMRPRDFSAPLYPRGLLEEAWAQIVDELGTEIEHYKAKPYRKVPPSPELIEKRENAEASGVSRHVSLGIRSMSRLRPRLTVG